MKYRQLHRITIDLKKIKAFMQSQDTMTYNVNNPLDQIANYCKKKTGVIIIPVPIGIDFIEYFIYSDADTKIN